MPSDQFLCLTYIVSSAWTMLRPPSMPNIDDAIELCLDLEDENNA